MSVCGVLAGNQPLPFASRARCAIAQPFQDALPKIEGDPGRGRDYLSAHSGIFKPPFSFLFAFTSTLVILK